MADFSNQQRAGAVRDIAAKADEESSCKIHGFGVSGGRESLQHGSKKHKHVSKSCAISSAKVVCNVWGEEQYEEAAEAWHCSV